MTPCEKGWTSANVSVKAPSSILTSWYADRYGMERDSVSHAKLTRPAIFLKQYAVFSKTFKKQIYRHGSGFQ